MTESELKKLTIGYLALKQKQGTLMWLRLNAGIILKGNRRIYLVPPGTADFLVIQKGKALFIELKGERGKLTDAQTDFGKLAKEHGADYVVVRDFEGLVNIC